MKTIAAAVEAHIKSKPFLISALTQGIINLTSLSRIMQEEIQAQTQKPVHTGAIVMALKRLSTDLEFRHSHKIIKTLGQIVEYCGGERPVTISREISKKFEETLRGTAAEVLAVVEERGGLKGELVLCIGA